jgi:hypothetical protein
MSEPRKQIGFEQGGIGSVLKRHQLEVPANQRDYSWAEEVRELYEDLVGAINEGKEYFLGTIVTIPRERTLEVVDGQQRLATTALLLTAIRDYCREINDGVLGDAIETEFLAGFDRPRRKHIPKLRLNTDDNDLFEEIIADVPSRKLPRAQGTGQISHRRLLEAFAEANRHVRKFVAAADLKEHGDMLERLVAFIEHRVPVVLLQVPDDADAYMMFETLNDRGLRTSQADLVKNHLFGKAADRLSEVQSRWSYMRGALETLDDEEVTITFVRHVLVLEKGYLRNPAEAYAAVQEIAKAEQPTLTFARQLETLAHVYVATFNSDHDRWNEYPDAARRAIRTLNLLDIKPMQPLVLAIAEKLPKREAAAALSFLVSLGVRLVIASTIRSASVERPLSEAAKGVFSGSLNTAAKLRAHLKTLTPSDSLFVEAFENARVTNARLGRYYLRSLEMAVKGIPSPWFIPTEDAAVINLEHVLPEKPEANWPQFSQDDVAQYSKRLGNMALMLTKDNSNLRSASFEAKRRVYAQSGYELTSQIAAESTWTRESIIERQKTLARLAAKTWPSA